METSNLSKPDELLDTDGVAQLLGVSKQTLYNWRSSGRGPAAFRHAHVALLIKQKAQPKEIQSRLGHTSIRTTMDRYGHLFEGSDELVARQLDEMLQNRSAPSTRLLHVPAPSRKVP